MSRPLNSSPRFRRHAVDRLDLRGHADVNDIVGFHFPRCRFWEDVCWMNCQLKSSIEDEMSGRTDAPVDVFDEQPSYPVDNGCTPYQDSTRHDVVMWYAEGNSSEVSDVETKRDVHMCDRFGGVFYLIDNVIRALSRFGRAEFESEDELQERM